MAKQRKVEDQPCLERLERSVARWPETESNGVTLSPTTIGRYIDDLGNVWVLRRGLNRSLARRLAASADAMIVDEGLKQTDLAGQDRSAIWASIEKHAHMPDEEPEDHLSYEPYEFDTEAGLTMLFLERRY